MSEKQSDQQKEDKRKQDGQKRSSFSTSIDGVEKVTNVDPCNLNHDLEVCYAFLKKSIDDRKLFLMEKKLCFGCYGKDHIAKGRLNKRKCKTCLQTP